MNINDLNSLLIDFNPTEQSPELCDIINAHNASVITFSQGLAVTALTSLLIEKGIINANELDVKLNQCLQQSNRQFKTLTENANALLEFVSSESKFNEELAKMHESLETDVVQETSEIQETTEELTAQIVDVFESTEAVDTTEE